MARALVEAGHSVTVICGAVDTAVTGVERSSRGAARGIVDGINVIQLDYPYSNKDSLPRRAAMFIAYAMASTWFVLREPHDVLFATSTPLTAAIPGIVARILRRKQTFVFEVRDLWPDLPLALGALNNKALRVGMQALERAAYRAADACVGLAPGICDAIGERGPGGLPVALIPNGSDTELFKPRSESPVATDLPLRTIFAGTHGIANGLDAVVDAAIELQSRGRSDIEVHLVGDGKLKAHLIGRAERAGLTNLVFHDPVPKRELAQRLPEFDVGLMILANTPAFYYGTSPNKFFEYLAAGLCVVNNYPGWVADLVQESRCGLVVPPDSASQLATALEQLADDRAFVVTCGEEARRLGEQQFAWSIHAERFVGLLEATKRRPRGLR